MNWYYKTLMANKNDTTVPVASIYNKIYATSSNIIKLHGITFKIEVVGKYIPPTNTTPSEFPKAKVVGAEFYDAEEFFSDMCDLDPKLLMAIKDNIISFHSNFGNYPQQVTINFNGIMYTVATSLSDPKNLDNLKFIKAEIIDEGNLVANYIPDTWEQEINNSVWQNGIRG